jgi:hypothetical protein
MEALDLLCPVRCELRSNRCAIDGSRGRERLGARDRAVVTAVRDVTV